jgi:small subunit ribosomal protein S4e
VTNHQKRLSVPDSWPVGRKTGTFTVKAQGPHGDDGVPLVILLRDVLGYVDDLGEAKYALNEGNVLVNGDEVTDASRPIGMFDILGFAEREEYYRVFPGQGGRLALTGISEDAAGSKLGKVVGKRNIAGGRTQVNLHDGGNLVLDDAGDVGVGDSLVIDNDDGSVVAQFPYEEGCLVTAVRGSHSGRIGRVTEVDVTLGSGSNHVTFESADGESYETVEEYVVVIDEVFAGEEWSDESEADGADEAATDDDADAQEVEDADDSDDLPDDAEEVSDDE